ncbi:hypothetical protein L828_1672 [Mycobacteroides abscessus MAB_030201_1061]|nr:hypothetical protein L835_1621 [Mycobacteroides abscessus MAB_110811_1470]ETZ94773.1 hypothetical protein L828_1672 [Mycobacteroides abscessus MAB_030201_1061]
MHAHAQAVHTRRRDLVDGRRPQSLGPRVGGGIGRLAQHEDDLLHDFFLLHGPWEKAM